MVQWARPVGVRFPLWGEFESGVTGNRGHSAQRSVSRRNWCEHKGNCLFSRWRKCKMKGCQWGLRCAFMVELRKSGWAIPALIICDVGCFGVDKKGPLPWQFALRGTAIRQGPNRICFLTCSLLESLLLQVEFGFYKEQCKGKTCSLKPNLQQALGKVVMSVKSLSSSAKAFFSPVLHLLP